MLLEESYERLLVVLKAITLSWPTVRGDPARDPGQSDDDRAVGTDARILSSDVERGGGKDAEIPLAS